MSARLVRLEGDREIATVPLDDELVIGRDPSDTDLVIDHPRISRRHVRVLARGDGHVVEDLNSSNGTTLNGEPLRGAAALEPGDVIVLGDAVTFEYGVGSSRAAALITVGAGVALVLAVALAAFLWWSRPPAVDPLWEDAKRLASEAIAASAEGDHALVKRRLTESFDLLWSNGRLDDIPHGPQAREKGLAKLSSALGEGADLNRLYRRALEASRPKLVAAPTGGCRLDAAEGRDFDACLRERTEAVLTELLQDPGRVPESFYGAVRDQLRLLVKSLDVATALERGRPHMDMMGQELEAQFIPGVLRYLPLIESAYRNDATSDKAAGGMWQFMPATARQYGLTVGGGVDERRDPRKATRAAANYLNDLAFEFGGDALLLAIASYNRGENGVRAALRKQKDYRTERTYWSLAAKGLLPDETRDYVPRFVAAAVLGEGGIPLAAALR